MTDLTDRPDLVIRHGTVVTATAVFAADIAITGEQIAAVGRDLRGQREIDATGQYVIPGACLLYTSPSPRDRTRSRMPSSA